MAPIFAYQDHIVKKILRVVLGETGVEPYCLRGLAADRHSEVASKLTHYVPAMMPRARIAKGHDAPSSYQLGALLISFRLASKVNELTRNDLNVQCLIQSQVCYRYTTGHRLVPT